MIHSFPTRRSSDLERGQEIFSSKVEGRPVIGVQEADLETFGILRLGGEAGNVAPDLLLGNEAVVAAYIDRKSTRLNPVTNAHLVCRLLLEKNKQVIT